MHQLCLAAHGAIGKGVEVADDDVGSEADVEQRVGATVDRDEHRAKLPDVRAQRRKIVLVVVATHDDHRVASRDLRFQRRKDERFERDVGFLRDVVERVLGEPTELVADTGPRRLHPLLDVVLSQQRADRELLVTPPQRAVAQLDDVAVAYRVHDPGPDGVEQRHTRARNLYRPLVRIAPADRLGRVDDSNRAGVDEAVGRDAIDVLVVDDRDLAPFESLGEVLRPESDARDTDDDVALAALQQPGHQALASDLWRPATASNSRACRRAWSDSPTPASIRESSLTRASSSSNSTRASVRPPRSSLRTES